MDEEPVDHPRARLRSLEKTKAKVNSRHRRRREQKVVAHEKTHGEQQLGQRWQGLPLEHTREDGLELGHHHHHQNRNDRNGHA